MERNFETVMIEQCAPTLAGLKPANLFRLECRDRAALYARVEGWNAALNPKGVRLLESLRRSRRRPADFRPVPKMHRHLPAAVPQRAAHRPAYRGGLNFSTSSLDILSLPLAPAPAGKSSFFALRPRPHGTCPVARGRSLLPEKCRFCPKKILAVCYI